MRKIFFYTSMFLFCWVYSVLYNVADWDLWARLAVGKIFFQTGTVLKHDIFSYTPTKDIWVDHEWGSGVIFYFLMDHFGDAGLLLLKISGFFIILILISRIVKLQSNKPNTHFNFLLYFLVVLAAFNGVGGTVRCQLFTFIFFTLWIYVLEKVRRGNDRLLWILPATMLIWANVHGGFMSGIGLLVIYSIGEFLNKKPFKKYLLILIPTLLVTLINPYGLKYWDYIIQAVTMPRHMISEWKHTDLIGSGYRWIGFKILLGISVISFVYTFIKYKPKFRDLDKVKYLILAVTLFLALKHIKHQAFFTIAACGFLYYDFYGMLDYFYSFIILKSNDTAKKFMKYISVCKDWLVYTVIFLGGCLLVYANPVIINLNTNYFPVGSVEFVKLNKLSGNLITVFHWGSYAAWKLYPDCFLAIDGRYEEVYPDEIFDSTHNFIYINNKHWYDFINKYHTDILILEKKNLSYKLILSNKFWKQIYDDKISAVFVPANKARKSYIIPKIDQKKINREKYITDINFID